MAYDKDLDLDIDGDSPVGQPRHNGFSSDPEMEGLSLYEKKPLS